MSVWDEIPCIKGQLISKCLYEVIVWTKIPTKNLIISALKGPGQKLSKFSLVFWSKRWLHKDILKLTDPYLAIRNTMSSVLFLKSYWCLYETPFSRYNCWIFNTFESKVGSKKIVRIFLENQGTTWLQKRFHCIIVEKLNRSLAINYPRFLK